MDAIADAYMHWNAEAGDQGFSCWEMSSTPSDSSSAAPLSLKVLDIVDWAPCVVLTKELIVYQGDSLGWAADKTMLAKLQWFLADVTDVQGQWTEKPLTVPNQGLDSRSCGIIALNAIHTFI